MAYQDHPYNSDERPKPEGTPHRGTENSQIQWVIENVSQLKVSHESLATAVRVSKDSLTSNLDHKLELLKANTTQRSDSIDSKLSHMDDRLNERLKAIDERIQQNQNLLVSKIENAELKLGKAVSDSKIDSIKWMFGLAFGLPSVAWTIVQIVEAFTK